MEKIMTLNEYIAKEVENHLRINNMVEIQNVYPEEYLQLQMNMYILGDFENHSRYLIEKWKNKIDDVFVGNSKINYNRQGTFDELCDYSLEIGIEQLFNEKWLDDILHTNNILK
jgi:hypothetical protein